MQCDYVKVNKTRKRISNIVLLFYDKYAAIKNVSPCQKTQKTKYLEQKSFFTLNCIDNTYRTSVSQYVLYQKKAFNTQPYKIYSQLITKEVDIAFFQIWIPSYDVAWINMVHVLKLPAPAIHSAKKIGTQKDI